MTHMAFIVPAYVLTVGGLLAMLGHSWISMRRAEAAAQKLQSERRR
jgi:Heme exporter protein D (CcmD)